MQLSPNRTIEILGENYKFGTPTDAYGIPISSWCLLYHQRAWLITLSSDQRLTHWRVAG